MKKFTDEERQEIQAHLDWLHEQEWYKALKRECLEPYPKWYKGGPEEVWKWFDSVDDIPAGTWYIGPDEKGRPRMQLKPPKET